ILHRAKYLFETNYRFNAEPVHFISFFNAEVQLDDYIQLDENIVMYYFQMWLEEEDAILRDLCERFVNRHLFKYVAHQPEHEKEEWNELCGLFREAGIDPDYYLAIDSSSDLPYDFYRPGEEEVRMP